MALTYEELESITNDYFIADGRKAVDIYFKVSFLLTHFMKGQKGLWKRPNGGHKYRVPLEYGGAEGGFYTRSDALSSDDKEVINAAYFNPKHAYGNATIYRTDELENAGPYAEVEIVAQRNAGAQKTCANWLANTIYGAGGDDSVQLTGLRCLTSETATTAYGGIAENDCVAPDGTKPWEGKTNTTTEAISLGVVRTLRSDAKIYDGPEGKPDVATTTEALFNVISGLLQVQQRFVTDKDTVKAGFSHVWFEGMIIAADDFCPSGYMFAINSAFFGFAVHSEGYFAREPWSKLVGPAGRTMKIFWDGNAICSNRKAHKAHSNLS